MRRFFCAEAIEGKSVELSGSEAHHLLHVDRLGVGDEAELFDGRSGAHRARVVEVSGSWARLEVFEQVPEERLPSRRVTLLSGVPKGRRMDVLVQMTCELGVERLVPVISARSVVRPGPNKVEHWRRIVIESCKQCGRNVLMRMEEPVMFSEALCSVAPDALKLVMCGVREAASVREVVPEEPSEVVILVGPEGGFSEGEVSEAVEAGFVAASLGVTVLRTETAGVCASALVIGGVA